MTAGSAAEPSLEDLLAELEAAIAGLGDAGAPLDRLVADYEAASRLLAAAEARLAAATARIAERAGG